MSVTARLAQLACVLVLLAGCTPRGSWNQELAMVFDTPSGPMRFVSVQEVSLVGAVRWMGEFDHTKTTLIGEAVVADLNGTVLYLMLDGVNDLMFHTLRETGGTDLPYRDALRPIRAQTEALTVPEALYPTIVTFSDPADPLSVIEVQPADITSLAGPGYALSAITIRVTDDPVTKGIVAARVPWLTDPSWWQDPTWQTLPRLVQEAIRSLIMPISELKP